MTNWTDIAIALSGSAATGGAGSAAVIRIGRRWLRDIAHEIANQANEPLLQKIVTVEHDITNVKLSLATQFGGNGGGMREAINELKVTVAEIKGQLSPASLPLVAGRHESPDAPAT